MTISNLQRRNKATCFRQKTAAPPTVLAVNCFQHPQPSKKYKSKTVRPNPSESVSPPIRKTDGHRRRSIIRALVSTHLIRTIYLVLYIFSILIRYLVIYCVTYIPIYSLVLPILLGSATICT